MLRYKKDKRNHTKQTEVFWLLLKNGDVNLSMKDKMKEYKNNGLGVLVLCLFAAVSLYSVNEIIAARPQALIVVDNDPKANAAIMPLYKKQERVFRSTNGMLSTLRIEKGGISFINSQCENHKCEEYGSIKKVGEKASCEQGSVTIEIIEKP